MGNTHIVVGLLCALSFFIAGCSMNEDIYILGNSTVTSTVGDVCPDKAFCFMFQSSNPINFTSQNIEPVEWRVEV